MNQKPVMSKKPIVIGLIVGVVLWAIIICAALYLLG